MTSEDGGISLRKVRQKEDNDIVEEEKDTIVVGSDITKLLNLIGQLQWRSSAPMQVHLNNYFADNTSAGLSFLVCARKLTSEYFVSCIGTSVVDPPICLTNWTSLLDISTESKALPAAFKQSCLHSKLSDHVTQNLFERTGDKFRNFLVIPSLLPDSSTPEFYVILVNTDENDIALDRDLKLVGECCRYCAPTLRNTLVAEEMRAHHENLKSIISQISEVAKNMSQPSFDQPLVQGTKKTMENLLRSRASAIFLKEGKYLVSKSTKYGRPLYMQNDVNLNNLKIPLGVGITGLVGTLGQVLYSNNATMENLRCHALGESKFENILSFPFIYDYQVLGVGEVYRRESDDYTETDSLYAKIIGKIFGPILKQSLLQRKMNNASNRRQILALQDPKKLQGSNGTQIDYLEDKSKCTSIDEFGKFDFLPSNVPQNHSISYIISAFHKLGLIAKLNVHVEALIRFLQDQSQRQASFPFRNWYHSFSCFQFLFSLLLNSTFNEDKQVRDIEIFTMLMATLCNGCDYGGATHRFQHETGPVLASVYSSAGQRNEHHAISQSLETLNDPDFNFMISASPEMYKEFLQLFDVMILYTDVADFVKIIKNSGKSDGTFTFDTEKRSLLLQLLMVCSKISDHARVWKHAIEIGDRAYQEFRRFNQSTCSTRIVQLPGVELPPIRAQLQSHFIASVCIPCFKILQKLIPEAKVYVSYLESNLKNLDSLANHLKKRGRVEGGEQDSVSSETMVDAE